MALPKIADLGNLGTWVSAWTSSIVGNDADQGAKPVKVRIVYCPPPAEAVEAFAHKICQELGQGSNETFNTPDVIWGFTEFVNISNTIAAYRLNQTTIVEQAEPEVDIIPERQ